METYGDANNNSRNSPPTKSSVDDAEEGECGNAATGL
jgi:hypothetical protein